MNWLHHFIRNVEKKRIDQWILLICDGFNFHATFFFLKLVIVNKIVLFRFLIHSTYLTQSLNVKIFQAYKHHHDNVMNKIVRQKNVKFNRLNFLTIFQNFRNAIFKSKIVKNVWKLIEIVSFDSSVIIDSLKKHRDREVLLSNTSSISKFEDDCFQRTSRDFSLHKQHIKIFRDRFRNDLNIDASILRFLKINEKQTTALKFHTRNLNNCQRTFVKRNNRERFSNTVICFNNVIIVRNCWKLYSIHLIKKLKKVKSKAKRETVKAVKNFFNWRLISTTKNVVVKLKNMSDEVIARVVVDEIKLMQLKKKTKCFLNLKRKKNSRSWFRMRICLI